MRGKGWIPYNYNLLIAKLIYGSICKIDEELATRLHNGCSFKYFTFSLLQVPKKKTSRDGIFIEGAAHFFFSSPLSDITTTLVQGLLEDPEQKIGKTKFYIEEIQLLRKQGFSEKAIFQTLSPVVVRILENKGNTLKTVDLNPLDERFVGLLNNNLKKKYEGLCGKTGSNISFSIMSPIKSMRLKIRNTYHRGSMMTFRVEGDRDLISLGYEVGFGEKNSLGFGMVDISE